MKNSKLISVLAALPEEEFSEFIAYVNNDFFNRKLVLRPYLEILAGYVSDDHDLPPREAIFLNLFPSVQASETPSIDDHFQRKVRKRMDNLTYELRGHLHDYLIWKTGQEKTPEREFRLLKALQARDAREAFSDQFRKLDRLLDRDFRNHSKYHLHKYNLKQASHEFNSTSRNAVKDSGLSDAIAHLDAHYAHTKLSESWVVMLREIVFNQMPRTEGLAAALTLAENSPYRDDFLIKSYRHAVRDMLNSSLTKERTLAMFEELRFRFSELEFDVAFGVLSMITNCLTMLQNFYGERLQNESFKIMSYGLEKGLLHRGSVLSFATFSNLVLSALKAEELSWAEDFIQEYKGQLFPEVREVTIAISTARLRFHQKDYRAVLDILQARQVIASPIQKLISKALRIQCLYEMEENDLLENDLEAGRKYAERCQEVGQPYTEKFGQFVHFVRQLYIARLGKKVPAEILVFPSHDRSILYAEWLQEKGVELKGKG